MAEFIFISGGIRSGKSGYAVELAFSLKERVCYVATCINPDHEMQERIKLHKRSRPAHWQVREEGKEISPLLANLEGKCDIVLIDCLGLVVSNLLAEGLENSEILAKLKELAQTIAKSNITVIFVSNEVGGGLVPDNLLGRRFCDLLGWANQIMAKEADKVILMHAGIPMIIKGGNIAENK